MRGNRKKKRIERFSVSRIALTKLHLLLAAFMFPAVVMFLVTGALYTWGNKGEWREQTVQVALETPLVADEQALRSVALSELAERDLPAPSGKSNVSEKDGEIALYWGGARSEISLSSTDDPLIAEATIKEASFHRWLVQLHKAKGSTAFKAYATLLATVLFVLVASGLVMGLQVKAMRRLTAVGSIAGLVTFAGFVMLG